MRRYLFATAVASYVQGGRGAAAQGAAPAGKAYRFEKLAEGASRTGTGVDDDAAVVIVVIMPGRSRADAFAELSSDTPCRPGAP